MSRQITDYTDLARTHTHTHSINHYTQEFINELLLYYNIIHNTCLSAVFGTD